MNTYQVCQVSFQIQPNIMVKKMLLDIRLGTSWKFTSRRDVKILSVDGVEPTTENIKNQTYPISTYLYCVTLKSNQKENVKKIKRLSSLFTGTIYY